ncbi:MAG: sporulation integral membrane protein YtvI [Lachnospiraceae bacterium]
MGEQKQDSRSYWKIAVSLAFSLIGTILFIGIGAKMLLYFMPFVIGWFISFIANPLVCWLEKRLKIVKELGSMLIIVVVLAVILSAVYFGGSKLVAEIGSLIKDVPDIYHQLEEGLHQIGQRLDGFFNILPVGIQTGWNAIVTNLDQTLSKAMSQWSDPAVEAAGNFVKKIPGMLIGVIVSVVSAYFFIAEREQVIIWSKKITPEPIQKRMTMVIDNLKYAVGGYFKAQFKIMAVVGVILFIGFGVLGVYYAILLAILIAFLDFLPFFGTGTALIPWALYQFLVGHYKMAIGLVVLYAVTQVVRQLIQPKLIGDDIGLNPLLTLVFLYTGYKLGSLLGMIFAVPIGMIIINMYKAGAFDYILDDVKLLINGIIRLREP